MVFLRHIDTRKKNGKKTVSFSVLHKMVVCSCIFSPCSIKNKHDS